MSFLWYCSDCLVGGKSLFENSIQVFISLYIIRVIKKSIKLI